MAKVKKAKKKPVKNTVSKKAGKSKSKSVKKKPIAKKKKPVVRKTIKKKPAAKKKVKKHAPKRAKVKAKLKNKVKPRIKVPTFIPPKPKPAPVVKLPEPTNTKKEKYQLEFEFRSSKAILFSYLSDSSGMAGWFADEVRSSDHNYTFVWENTEVHAKLVAAKDNQLVRFQWTDENDGTYFQFEIKEDDITSEIALLITNWANP